MQYILLNNMGKRQFRRHLKEAVSHAARFMMSLVWSFLSAFVFSPMFWIGYAVCVLFPVPYINSTVISLWSKFGGSIMSLFSKAETVIETEVSNVTTTVVASVTTTVSNTVANAVVTAPVSTVPVDAAPVANTVT